MARRISQIVGLSLAFFGAAQAEFSLCKFNFGVDMEKHSNAACNYVGCTSDLNKLAIPAGIDFIAMFVGHTDIGSGQIDPQPTGGREGTHIATCKAVKATPMWYSYIIAEGAKKKLGVNDCNAAGGLCTKGAQYIRDNRATILGQYQAYARYAATQWGSTSPFIIAIEPDFFQYTYSTQANKLSYAEAKTLLTDIAATVKKEFPSVWLSMDISPWADGNWWKEGIPYDQFKFMNSSGGAVMPDAVMKDGYSWASMWGNSKGLGMIADDGYGPSGKVESGDGNWLNASTLNSRIADGVVGYWLALGTGSYASTFANLRSQLKETKTCGGQPVTPKFSLTLNAGNGGSVTGNPAGTSFDSNTTIQLTAVAQTGYRFVSWSGDATGTSSPASLVLKKNSTVTATFAALQPSKFTLTVQSSNGGSINLQPNQTSFDSGATVSVTAVPNTGYTFANWTGALTTKTLNGQVVMNKNQTLGANFTPNTGVLVRKISQELALVQTRDGVSVQLTAQAGRLQASVVGIDGATETTLQNTSVPAGAFAASYSLSGLRPGLHVVRIVNGSQEFHGVVTRTGR